MDPKCFKRNMKRHLIGIDPSFKTMGVAVWTPSEQKLVCYSGKLQHCLNWIYKSYKPDEFVAVVENPNLDSPHYTLWKSTPLFLNDGGYRKKPRTVFGFINVILQYVKTELRRAGSSKLTSLPVSMVHVEIAFRSCMRKAQDVGKNKAAAEFTIDILRERGVTVAEITPSKRHRADKTSAKNPANILHKAFPTKTNRKQFIEYSGINVGPRDTNEHTRDAATLVVKRTVQNVELQAMEQALKRKAQKQTRKRLKNII